MNNKVFITGGTGYLGKRLIPALINAGFEVTVLVRKGSEGRLPPGCNIITGNALDKAAFENKIAPAETFIQLVGTPHPGPGKEEQFNKVDKVSIEQSAAAAAASGIKHFIYLSVAMPAPVLKEYIKIRKYGEELIKQSGQDGKQMHATFIRPWYVLGPGHWWPYPLIPFYKLLELFPPTRSSAKRLGLVKLNQIVAAIVNAVKHPPKGVEVVDVEKIQKFKP